MGVDATNFNGDRRQDLFVFNLDHKFYSVYENTGVLISNDRNWETGCCQINSYAGLLGFEVS